MSLPKSVAYVETRADFGGVDSIQNPQNIARVPEKQMRQFIFKHAHDAEFFAATDRRLLLRGGWLAIEKALG